jgi:hypothetical protein
MVILVPYSRLAHGRVHQPVRNLKVHRVTRNASRWAVNASLATSSQRLANASYPISAQVILLIPYNALKEKKTF